MSLIYILYVLKLKEHSGVLHFGKHLVYYQMLGLTEKVDNLDYFPKC